MGALAAALGRAGVRSRRRRLPRPPKFTRRQKIALAIDTLFFGPVFSLSYVYSADPAWLILLASAAAHIHATFQDALRPPIGGYVSSALGFALSLSGCLMVWL